MATSPPIKPFKVSQLGTGKGPVSCTQDRVDELLVQLRMLTELEVLVGFPESTAERSADADAEAGSTPPSNATLGYIHDNGAPESNIPARPFMIPGILAARPKIVRQMMQVGVAAFRLTGDPKDKLRVQRVQKAFHAVGLTAQYAIRAKINEGLDPPLAPGTIAARARARGTKSMRKGEKKYFELLGQGMSPGEAQAGAGIKALINTGQLRNAVNYVIRPRKARNK
jgi:hypothetical protein